MGAIFSRVTPREGCSVSDHHMDLPLDPGVLLQVTNDCSETSSGGDFAPDPLSSYSIEHSLGDGAFGRTYKAHHSSLPSHPLVIKVPHGRAAASFLRREAALLCSLDHPGIIPFREFVSIPGNCDFLVMEYAAGGNLASRIAAGPNLSVLEICRTLLSILQALAYIHLRGILHLDVK